MKLRAILLSFIFLLFSAQVGFARDVVITSDKSSLFNDDELQLTASISGFTIGETIYLKGAFFQDGTSNYFGYTKNNSDWIKNSVSATSQRSVKVGEWDGNLILRNDNTDTGYKGNGLYKVKLGFYYVTSGGNVSSVNWSQNSLDVSLSFPTYTPSPKPTTTSTPIPTKTPTPSMVTATPVPTLGINTRIVTVSVSKTLAKSNSSQTVLGEKVQRFTPVQPTPEEFRKENEFVFPPVILVVGILVIILACGILLFQEWKKQRKLDL